MIADLNGQVQLAKSESERKEDEILIKDAENQRLQAEIARLTEQLLEKQIAQEKPAAAAETPSPAINEAPLTTTDNDPDDSDNTSEGPHSPKAPPSTPPAYACRTVAEEDGRRQEWLEKREASARAEEERQREEDAQRIRDLQLQAYHVAAAQQDEESNRRRSYSYSRQNSSQQMHYRY